MPDSLLHAPEQPPGLRVTTPANDVEPHRIAVDWTSLSGPLAVPPERIEWPEARFRDAPQHIALEFDTAQIPTRVVLYRYPGVDDFGVPDQSSGTEEVCHTTVREAPCWIQGEGHEDARVTVPTENGILRPYWVVHAAWRVFPERSSPAPAEGEASSVEIASASWVLRIEQE
ncbi:hypothetical protein [Nocardiopsis sp. LOL_012]|uniref:hypothetical protein n=1 Tax=Nocardiopsis sp. LOL_012 TaxID=3345409 RepID=UPI003A89D13E